MQVPSLPPQARLAEAHEPPPAKDHVLQEVVSQTLNLTGGPLGAVPPLTGQDAAVELGPQAINTLADPAILPFSPTMCWGQACFAPRHSTEAKGAIDGLSSGG